MSNLIDIHAEELLPEIKQLFETGQVYEMISGDCETVSEKIRSKREPLQDFALKNINELYRGFNKILNRK
jgi:hypothetical protein